MTAIPPAEEPETRFDIHSINYVYEPHKELQIYTRDNSAVWLVENRDPGQRPYMLCTLSVNKMLRDEYMTFLTKKLPEFLSQLKTIEENKSEDGRAEQVFIQAMLEDCQWITHGVLVDQNDINSATPDASPALTSNAFHNLLSDIKGRVPTLRRKELNTMLSTVVPSLLMRRIKLMGVLHGTPIRHAAAINVSGQSMVADYWNVIRNNHNMPGFFDPKEELGFKITRVPFANEPKGVTKSFRFKGRQYEVGQCLQIAPCMGLHGAPLIKQSFTNNLMQGPYIRLGYYITHLSQKISSRSYAGVDGASIPASLTDEQIAGLLNSALSRSAESVIYVSVSHQY